MHPCPRSDRLLSAPVAEGGGGIRPYGYLRSFTLQRAAPPPTSKRAPEDCSLERRLVGGVGDLGISRVRHTSGGCAAYLLGLRRVAPATHRSRVAGRAYACSRAFSGVGGDGARRAPEYAEGVVVSRYDDHNPFFHLSLLMNAWSIRVFAARRSVTGGRLQGRVALPRRRAVRKKNQRFLPAKRRCSCCPSVGSWARLIASTHLPPFVEPS